MVRGTSTVPRQKHTHCACMSPIASRLAGAGLLGVRGSFAVRVVQCNLGELWPRLMSKPLHNLVRT